MNILEIIEKKKNKETLSDEEIKYAFLNYLNGNIKDYQMSSLLMAITLNSMTFDETLCLTDVMLNSGRKLDTSKIEGIQVDKHSTGGVGDKTSLIIGPIIASLGLKMGKLSGRGLSHTGGTIDKLESIPGFKVSLGMEEFIQNINKVGFSECEQTTEFTPLDKEIYSLRSVTGTVESIPLIAASIMSKKLALGAKYLLMDIKVGHGALLKTKKEAVELANLMIEIGKKYQRQVIPVLTDMDMPLGDNIGNSLEVIEALDVLKGKNGQVRDLCIELSSLLYSKATKKNLDLAKKEVIEVLDNGSAYQKFLEFVKAQGGDIENIAISSNIKPVYSKKEGILKSISAIKIGMLSLTLGAGRINKGDKIDESVGIVINKHLKDNIKKGDILCYLYQNNDEDYTDKALEAFEII